VGVDEIIQDNPRYMATKGKIIWKKIVNTVVISGIVPVVMKM
jgi:hypothetical protein